MIASSVEAVEDIDELVDLFFAGVDLPLDSPEKYNVPFVVQLFQPKNLIKRLELLSSNSDNTHMDWKNPVGKGLLEKSGSPLLFSGKYL